MLKYGRWMVILGVVFTVIGAVSGFAALAIDADDMAKWFFSFVTPFSFLGLFVGLVMVILSEPRNHDE